MFWTILHIVSSAYFRVCVLASRRFANKRRLHKYRDLTERATTTLVTYQFTRYTLTQTVHLIVAETMMTVIRNTELEIEVQYLIYITETRY